MNSETGVHFLQFEVPSTFDSARKSRSKADRRKRRRGIRTARVERTYHYPALRSISAFLCSVRPSAGRLYRYCGKVTDLKVLLSPPTQTAAHAREVVERWSSEAMVNHCLRSWVWAVRLADTRGLNYDAELLYVAAMLHDLGAADHFNSVAVPFEDAGGAVAWSFAAGAGWPAARRRRVEEVIQRHAWAEVDPRADPEGFLLEAATSLDVAGSGSNNWSPEFMSHVVMELPRLEFGREFGDKMADQARRKPDSEAARFHAHDGVGAGERFWAKALS